MIDMLLDRGLLPDPVIRAGIRRIVKGRLSEQGAGGPKAQAERASRLEAALRNAPIAIATDAANQQHYKVPSAFFAQVLGPHLKYSAGWWPDGVQSLSEAEHRMLALTTNRAGIEDGDTVLDLGCGWGAFGLHAAAAFPRSRIVAVSNSRSQAEFIRARARERQLANIEVITADINTFEPGCTFDRIVSVEMLEHVRNHRALFRRIAGWLEPRGRLFVHVFAHRQFPYLFESRGASDWMARHFFTGGMMPSADWLTRFQDDLVVDARWTLGGEHYKRTAEAWLGNFDSRREAIDPILAEVYGGAESAIWQARWRVFFMACAEMFGYAGGSEWCISHLRFRKRNL
jgi:cyclopropane-fatty-acyl-phospholipid synthase